MVNTFRNNLRPVTIFPQIKIIIVLVELKSRKISVLCGFCHQTNTEGHLYIQRYGKVQDFRIVYVTRNIVS
jgi:hypothetical protein